MAEKVRLLLACSDMGSRDRLTHTLGEEFETLPATNVEESSSLLAQELVSLVFCEDRLPGGGCSGLLNEIKRSGTCTPVVVLSRTGDWEEYLAVLRLGAFDMLTPPYERLAIQTAAYNALQESRVVRGARAVEALPRMAPRSALRAAPNSAHARAYAAAGAPSGIPGERTPAREQAENGLPAAAENRTTERESFSMREGSTTKQGRVPDKKPAEENSKNSGIATGTGG
jgi:DNA-binding NtrC family response regulator